MMLKSGDTTGNDPVLTVTRAVNNQIKQLERHTYNIKTLKHIHVMLRSKLKTQCMSAFTESGGFQMLRCMLQFGLDEKNVMLYKIAFKILVKLLHIDRDLGGDIITEMDFVKYTISICESFDALDAAKLSAVSLILIATHNIFSAHVPSVFQ
jgi:hypothetical protein